MKDVRPGTAYTARNVLPFDKDPVFLGLIEGRNELGDAKFEEFMERRGEPSPDKRAARRATRAAAAAAMVGIAPFMCAPSVSKVSVRCAIVVHSSQTPIA